MYGDLPKCDIPLGALAMNQGRALRIGITIGLHAPDDSLWLNGIKQNALFLAKLFQQSPLRHQVILLNTTAVEISPRLPWDLAMFPTGAFDEHCDQLDVLFELGGQISQEQTRRIKAQGTRLISYCCGSEYVQTIEAMIFDRPLWNGIFINEAYDELWMIPQIWDLNRGFLQTFRKCPARKVPFVWDPMALQGVTATMPHQGEYRPHSDPKRLSIIEPNIDVLKFCLYPILIVEKVFREQPDDISFLHVASADHLARAEREFAGLMRRLQIVEAGKASFISRVQTPDFLSAHTDIVISHQWGLPLNYFYLECCWQGYPLIHNADLIPELGYYYPGHDLDCGAAHLAKALREHDQDWQAYQTRQRQGIQRFLATDQWLVSQYDALLQELVSA